MKKVFLTLMLVVFCVLSIKAVKEPVDDDGYLWEGKSESFKFGYVIGLTRGIQHCAEWFYVVKEPYQEKIDSLERLMHHGRDVVDCSKKSQSERGDCLARTFCSIILRYSNVLSDTRMGEEATYGQLIQGIDQLYKDYRNKQIPIVHLLELVKMEIQGESQAKVDSVARELREIFSKSK